MSALFVPGDPENYAHSNGSSFLGFLPDEEADAGSGGGVSPPPTLNLHVAEPG